MVFIASSAACAWRQKAAMPLASRRVVAPLALARQPLALSIRGSKNAGRVAKAKTRSGKRSGKSAQLIAKAAACIWLDNATQK